MDVYDTTVDVGRSFGFIIRSIPCCNGYREEKLAFLDRSYLFLKDC